VYYAVTNHVRGLYVAVIISEFTSDLRFSCPIGGESAGVLKLGVESIANMRYLGENPEIS
jgi:hypothetical protein